MVWQTDITALLLLNLPLLLPLDLFLPLDLLLILLLVPLCLSSDLLLRLLFRQDMLLLLPCLCQRPALLVDITPVGLADMETAGPYSGTVLCARHGLHVSPMLRGDVRHQTVVRNVGNPSVWTS